MSLATDFPGAKSVPAQSSQDAKKYTTSSHKASAKLKCPDCHANGLRRLPRKGLWQKFIASRLGLYPWECMFCRRTHLFRDRGVRQKPSPRN
jgi:hypothetical protein